MKKPVTLTMDNLPKPDEDHSHVIPQSEAAQNMYAVCVEMGMTPREAALHVLRIATKHVMEGE